jgi:hypothetical protein
MSKQKQDDPARADAEERGGTFMQRALSGVDSIGVRILWAVIWCAGYGVVWYMAWFRPNDAWVNWAILGAIVVSNLPPRPLRYLVAGLAEFAIAAVIFFVIQHDALALLLGLFAGVSIWQWLREIRGVDEFSRR